ncbi:RHS repeat-associated core domain-containing protein [bacterium]|nr:RHS repeat-associated core domain-containing protein [bacterium]
MLRKRGQRPLINNTKYIYDGFKVIQEKESGLLGNHAVTYLRGSSLDEILSRSASPSVYYYEDIRGSVRGITDANSNLIQSYEYTAFGERTSTAHGKNFLFFEKGINQPYGFTGRPIDKATGLYDYRFRDYNPEVGRFIQPDPLGQIPGPNIYAYCNNNPINWVDPWGMDTYMANRELGGNRAKSYYNPLTHTYVFTTQNGELEHTYSWGNVSGENGVREWHMDREEDIQAARESLERELAVRVADEPFDTYIDENFNERLDPNHSSHHNWWAWDNCKHETRDLIEEALREWERDLNKRN